MRFRSLLLSVVLFAVVAVAAAHAAPDPVVNAGFETGGVQGLAAGWSAQAPAGATIARDAAVCHAGSASLRLANLTAGSSLAESEPLALEVGHLYRLSAWIRTERAFSDPTARYPTALPATVTMASFPFTNHAPAVGATADWTRVETLFLATSGRDRVRLHLGLNGGATGTAWFDDVAVEEVDDITAYIPWETVRWSGPAYRFDDRGWIFAHVEGAPYQRGRQFGTLLAAEIAEYIRKLSIQESPKDPINGWNALRTLADATMLRGFEPEFLEEMKGIADGAAAEGAKVDGRPVDLLDVVTVNSAVDLGQLKGALRVTPTALTGRSFAAPEDDGDIPERLHKCSSFAATGPATRDGQVVFGQLFMWGGYTGVHFNVLLDLQPSTGHRVVFQTFPGGIHSGTDFYINDAGIVIGETTVAQTPFEPRGTPQSNRIRKAVQYGSSIDEVVSILRTGNNGLYTNDWPIADIKTGETAVFLLGTTKDRLWRSSDVPAPFGTPGFLWANNNNRDPEVRKEYVAGPDDAPFDATFTPWDRDVAFVEFYRAHRGAIDATAAVELWASSPINRAHACDGKVTTSELARQMAFLAHYGKTTLREKFPQGSNRRMPDLPGAVPHLTLGYSVVSPIFVTERLQAEKARRAAAAKPAAPPSLDLEAVKGRYAVKADRLWHGTVFAAGEGDGWLPSASAAYWQILHAQPDDERKAAGKLGDALAEITARLAYTLAHEADVVPVQARRAYDRFGPYRIPRIKGTFLLHQLRLALGNDAFLRAMAAVYAQQRGREVDTAAFTRAVSEASGRDLGPLVAQWTERDGVPDPRVAVRLEKLAKGSRVHLEVRQGSRPWRFFTSVAIDVDGKRLVRPLEVAGELTRTSFEVPGTPSRVAFNPFWDVPVSHDRYYAWSSTVDDFKHTLIVHGTARQDEANRTLALRWQTTLADAYAETLSPVVKDSEVSDADLAEHDLMVLAQAADTTLLARLGGLPVELGKNWFRWQGTLFAAPDDGLVLVLPNPRNGARALYLVLANSALQLHEMTKNQMAALPQWAVFKGAEIKEQGWLPVERFVFTDFPR